MAGSGPCGLRVVRELPRARAASLGHWQVASVEILSSLGVLTSLHKYGLGSSRHTFATSAAFTTADNIGVDDYTDKTDRFHKVKIRLSEACVFHNLQFTAPPGSRT